jgi:hypothetical protein
MKLRIFSPASFAAYRGVTRQMISKDIKRGKLHAESIGPRRYIIMPDEAERYLAVLAVEAKTNSRIKLKIAA